MKNWLKKLIGWFVSRAVDDCLMTDYGFLPKPKEAKKTETE